MSKFQKHPQQKFVPIDISLLKKFILGMIASLTCIDYEIIKTNTFAILYNADVSNLTFHGRIISVIFRRDFSVGTTH